MLAHLLWNLPLCVCLPACLPGIGGRGVEMLYSSSLSQELILNVSFRSRIRVTTSNEANSPVVYVQLMDAIFYTLAHLFLKQLFFAV
jgi:hypothetical protein